MGTLMKRCETDNLHTQYQDASNNTQIKFQNQACQDSTVKVAIWALEVNVTCFDLTSGAIIPLQLVFHSVLEIAFPSGSVNKLTAVVAFLHKH